jgi:preprotein translocase subunit SecG
MFTSFLPGVSADALKRMRQVVRGWRIYRQTPATLAELAKQCNPAIRGWWNYYGAFYRTAMHKLSRYLDQKLEQWARRKYKMLLRHERRSLEEAKLLTLALAIHEIDANIATSDATTMTEVLNDSTAAYLHRSSAWLVGGFAALALVLSVVGLYGVIAYSVSQRTREIGVRMALGAQRGSVYRLILTEAGWLMGIGIVAGLFCSVAAATLMRKLLFGTQAWDATTLAEVAVVLALSAMLASYLPARRAASVNPVEALRAE